MFTTSEIQQAIDIIHQQYSMMILTTLGNESLPDEDRLFLQGMGVNTDLVALQYPYYLQSFLLGRLAALLREPQMMQITRQDFNTYVKKKQFIPLSERERTEYGISREMTYNHLKGLADRVVGESRNRLLEENKKQIIQQTISDAVRDRKSIQSVISDLGHRTGDWGRDWKRIVVTEMQNIYNQGKAATLADKYGDEQLVWKQVLPMACRHCIRLYTTAGIGSEPRIFKLSVLNANGTNIGRAVADWLPVIGSTHPHCRCDLREVHKGQKWDAEVGAFVYSDIVERKVIRTSKIKVTVGTKEFLV